MERNGSPEGEPQERQEMTSPGKTEQMQNENQKFKKHRIVRPFIQGHVVTCYYKNLCKFGTLHKES